MELNEHGRLPKEMYPTSNPAIDYAHPFIVLGLAYPYSEEENIKELKKHITLKSLVATDTLVKAITIANELETENYAHVDEDIKHNREYFQEIPYIIADIYIHRHKYLELEHKYNELTEENINEEQYKKVLNKYPIEVIHEFVDSLLENGYKTNPYFTKNQLIHLLITDLNKDKNIKLWKLWRDFIKKLNITNEKYIETYGLRSTNSR